MTWVYVGIGLFLLYALIFGLCAAAGRWDKR